MREDAQLFRVIEILNHQMHASSASAAFAHLSWMLTTVKKEADWPADKRWRWVGYVAGSLSCFEDEELRIAVASAPALPNVHHETVLRAVNLEVLRGLPETDPQSTEVISPWWVRLAHPIPAVQVAFGVGVIQAQLEGLGLLDVTAERERTRPMFHRAYAACGWAPPPTLAP